MKISTYITFAVLVSVLSLSSHARPPRTESAPIEPMLIVCKDVDALTLEQKEELESSEDKVISFDEETREVCFQ